MFANMSPLVSPTYNIYRVRSLHDVDALCVEPSF